MNIVNRLYTFLSFAGMLGLAIGSPTASATEYHPTSEITVSNVLAENCQTCEVRSAAISENEVVFAWSESRPTGSQVVYKGASTAGYQNIQLDSAFSVAITSVLQESPRLLSEGDGTFSIFWMDNRNQILNQTFTMEGARMTNATVLVNSVNSIQDIDVVKLDDGKRLLVWSMDLGDGVLLFKGLKLNASNLPVGIEFEVARGNAWGTGAFSVVPMSMGAYWVAYEKLLDQGEMAIALSQFSKKDVRLSDVVVSTDHLNDNLSVHAVKMQDAGVRVTWVSQNINQSEIVSQRFDANGVTIGSNVVLATPVGQMVSHPKVSVLLDSSFLLTWVQNTNIFSKTFSFEGNVISDNGSLNSVPVISTSAVNQRALSVSALRDDTFVAVWREGSEEQSDLKGKVFRHARNNAVSTSAPTADAGPDIAYHGRSTYKLNGARSKDNMGGQSLQYLWTLLKKPEDSNTSLSNRNQVQAQFYPDRIGEYEFELEVTDLTNGEKDKDTVKFFNYNNKPVAFAGDDKQAQFVGMGIQLLGRDSFDADLDFKTYQWEVIEKPGNSDPLIDNPTSPTPRFTPYVQGTYVLGLTVKDAWSASDMDTMTISFINSRPLAHVIYSKNASVGEAVILDASGSNDGNRDSLQYQWHLLTKPEGSLVEITNATEELNSFVPDTAGTYNLSLIVNDGQIDSKPFNISVQVSPATVTPNSAPVAQAGEDSVYERLTTVLQLDGRQSTDADGDSLSYQWSFSSIPGDVSPSFDNPSSPTPRFQPTATGDYIIQLSVNDGEFESTDEVIISIVSVAPKAHAGFDTMMDAEQTITLIGHNSRDGNGQALSYTWEMVAAPDETDAQFNDATLVNPTFTTSVAGTYQLRITVTDTEGMSDSDIVNVNVMALPIPEQEEVLPPAPELAEPQIIDDEDMNQEADGESAAAEAETDAEPEPVENVLSAKELKALERAERRKQKQALREQKRQEKLAAKSKRKAERALAAKQKSGP